VSQYFWPENFRINDLVAELSARGHEVTVLTGEPNYPDGEVFPEFRENPGNFTTHAGADIVRVPILARHKGSVRLVLNYLSFVLTGSLLGVWRLRGRPFDVIFFYQTSPITAALPALLLRKLKRAPLAIWVLDLWPETLAAIGVVKSKKGLALVGRLVKFIYARCDRILVQSRGFYSNIERYAGTTSRVRYFPGWAEPIFQGGLDAIDRAPEMAEFAGSFTLLFAGNIGEAQDFPAILDAAEALRDRPDIRWAIVGDGRAAESVREEINRRQLHHQVKLLGRFSMERMPSFFRAADALLVTLKADPIFSMTIPGKVQSYLAAGMPLVAMLDGEGANVIKAAGAGMVSPAGNGQALAANVRLLADMSAAERAAMGARAQACCAKDFDRSALISSLEQWMEELVMRPHTS